MKRFALALLATLSLFSCSPNNGASSSFSSGEPAIALPLVVANNGENLAISEVAESVDMIAPLCRSITYDEMDRKINDGVPFIIYLYGLYCQSCTAIEEEMAKAILSSGLEIYAIESQNLIPTMVPLVRNHEELGITNDDAYTPKMFLIEGPKEATQVAPTEYQGSLLSMLGHYAQSHNFYSFISQAGFASFLSLNENSLIYFSDEEDSRYKALLEGSSSKFSAFINLSKLGEEDLLYYQSLYGEDLSQTLIKKSGDGYETIKGDGIDEEIASYFSISD